MGFTWLSLGMTPQPGVILLTQSGHTKKQVSYSECSLRLFTWWRGSCGASRGDAAARRNRQQHTSACKIIKSATEDGTNLFRLHVTKHGNLLLDGHLYGRRTAADDLQRQFHMVSEQERRLSGCSLAGCQSTCSFTLGIPRTLRNWAEQV